MTSRSDAAILVRLGEVAAEQRRLADEQARLLAALTGMAGIDLTPAAAPSDPEQWYIERVAAYVASGRVPTVADDAAAAVAAGYVLSRDYLRELRRRHAPAAWSKP